MSARAKPIQTYGSRRPRPALPVTLKRTLHPADEAGSATATPDGRTVRGRPELDRLGEAASPPRLAARKEPAKVLSQTFLDFGQRDFHSVECGECGMRYARGLPEDDEAHAAFHRDFKRRVCVHPVSPEALVCSLVATAAPGRAPTVRVVIAASPASPPLWRKLAAFVDAAVAPEMNVTASVLEGEGVSGAMCLSPGGIVEACVVYEPLTAARRRACDASTTCVGAGGEEEAARLGVRLVWVHASVRGQGVAAGLLDAVCGVASKEWGVPISRDNCAINQPTPAGAALFQAFTRRPDFLVYAL